MPTRNTRYFFFGILFLTLGITTAIFLPFLTVLVLAISLAVVLHPLYSWFVKVFKKSWFSALLTMAVFILVICTPLFFIGSVIFEESRDLYGKIANGAGYGMYIENINGAISKYLPEGFDVNIQEKVGDLVALVSDNIANIFTKTLNTIFSFLLLILATFYLLRDGQKYRKGLIVLSPLSDTDDEKVLNKLKDAINGVVKGYLFIGLLQGILMGIGLTIFSVPNAALLGLLAGISSLIPSIGTSLVGVPVIIYLFATGDTAGAIGFTVWATALVGMVDNLLTPILVGRKVHLPPFVVLFAVLGGIALLGPVGILIGPLVISLLYALLSIYKTEFSK